MMRAARVCGRRSRRLGRETEGGAPSAAGERSEQPEKGAPRARGVPRRREQRTGSPPELRGATRPDRLACRGQQELHQARKQDRGVEEARVMDSHYWRERFTVEVRLIPESGLWSWEIWDTVRGEVAASSWVRDWTAYESREAALRAGQFQLTLGDPSLLARNR